MGLKAMFLDRDGTINIDKKYMYKIEEFEFEPGAVEALKIFRDLGYVIIVVTNQSGIGRGYYSETDLEKLHNYMDSLLIKEGIEIKKYYYCPHHESSEVDKYKKDCQCRKPSPGMILEGMEEFQIDPSLSYMVGDKMSDVEAGINAKVKPILLRTRDDIDFEKAKEKTTVFQNLYEFAKSLK